MCGLSCVGQLICICLCCMWVLLDIRYYNTCINRIIITSTEINATATRLSFEPGSLSHSVRKARQRTNDCIPSTVTSPSLPWKTRLRPTSKIQRTNTYISLARSVEYPLSDTNYVVICETSSCQCWSCVLAWWLKGTMASRKGPAGRVSAY